MSPGLGAATRYEIGFRPEVQGLRAIALLMVVVYHLYAGRVSGGVDVFLMLSAFFMTLSFVRRIESGAPLAIGRYWLRTFKRLLPLAVLTILGTLVALYRYFPESAIWDFRGEAIASALYFENWTLAANQVDYYAADHQVASPFQHFWSLSVQGQVFILWPLVFALAWWVRRRTGISSVNTLTIGFSSILAASLVHSVHLTSTNQQFAYFDTRARLWQFAFGSLLALAIPHLRPGRRLRVLLGWLGMAAMLSVGVLVDVRGAFPGWIAIWPLAGAASVVVAGQSGSRWGVDRFLGWTPVVRLGDSAYALYLVHWPLMITYLVSRDRSEVGTRSGIALILVSIVVAVLLTKLIERPIRDWQWAEHSRRGAALVIAISLLLGVGPAALWWQRDEERARLVAEALRADAVRNNPGAAALVDGYVYRGDPDAPVLPLTSELRRQWVSLSQRCSDDQLPDDAFTRDYCSQLPSPKSAKFTVVVVGNSHTEQFMGALTSLAVERDWQLVALLHPGCDFTASSPDEYCAAASAAFMQYLLRLQPDVVVANSTRSHQMNAQLERPVAGFENSITTLTNAGIRVVGIRDNPRFEVDPSVCLENGSVDECSVPRSAVLLDWNPAASFRGLDGYRNLDFTDLICPDDVCTPIIGNVLVWLDQDHLTRDYAETMAVPGRSRIVAAIEDLDEDQVF